jgi:hypothetical protein
VHPTSRAIARDAMLVLAISTIRARSRIRASAFSGARQGLQSLAFLRSQSGWRRSGNDLHTAYESRLALQR